MRNRVTKRRKKRLIILGSSVAIEVLILALLMGYLFTRKADPLTNNKEIIKSETTNPNDILTQYMSCVNTEDYVGMYDLLSEQSKNIISKEKFINRNQKIYEGIEVKNLKIQINEIKNLDNNKIISYTTNMETIAGELSFMNQVTLNSKEDNDYYIVWDSNIIFPNLSNEDIVKVSTLQGHRGSILDRNDVVLAGKGTVASVGLVPGKMGENMEDDIIKISEILNVSTDTIKKKLKATYVKAESFVPIKSIEQDEIKMKALLLEIPGIMISDADARVYPLGENAAHLIGFVQNINADELEEKKGQNYNSNSIIGKAGLEKLLEERIRGIDGYKISIVDKNGNKKETLAIKEAKNGSDIKLTVDSELQCKLYDQLSKDKSCSVVMNPKTGEILALVSTPSYDPNEFVLGMSNSRWQELKENKNKPLYNRFKAVVCPGSSFKPIIAAIGATTGIIDPEENFGHSGLSWQKDASWGSYKVTTLKDYGNQVDMENALIYSDNIYFAKAALKIGADKLAEQLFNLGFHETVPFEFGLSSSQLGSEKQFDTEIQLADSGYGQGKILVNPIHMASIYSAFVNKGNMVKPYLLYKENLTPEFWKEHVFTKEAVEVVCNDLVQVVENPNGTGHSAKLEGITIAGKTGTAEIKASKDDTSGTELGWFNAFTVSENKDEQILSLIMVEDVKNRGGSHYVIPIVKSVFEYMLDN